MNTAKSAACGVAVVIPALNEAASIGSLVRQIQTYATPIVVDDGSQDATAALAQDAGAIVVILERNQGYDRALEAGMQKSLELGFEYAITMDADGQHDPELLKLFFNELSRGADVVVGMRDRRQRFAELLFAIVTSALWGIQDPLCGMKGYRMELLQRAKLFDTYGSIGTELTLRAARSGCRIAQVPVPTLERVGVSRFGGGYRATWRILRAMGMGLVRASRLPKK